MYGIGLQLTSTTIIGGSYSPTSLFTANEVGYVYDLNDVTTLFKDTAGTQPVTAHADPVALRLDKSRSLALGAELVTNGTFNSDVSGWTDFSSAGGSIAWNASGFMDVINTTATARATQSFSATVGKSYRVQISNVGANQTDVYVGSTIAGGELVTTTIAAGSTGSYIVVATTTTLSISIRNFSPATTDSVDNISVRELAGNHATQSDAAKRPLYSLLPANGVRNLANGSADVGNAAVWPASIIGSGITATKVGSGFDVDGLPYVDYSVVGTASASSFLPATTSTSQRVPAANGQTWTGGFTARLISGTQPPANCGVRAEIAGETAPSTNTENSTPIAATISASEVLYSATYTFANAATNQARLQVTIRTDAGATVNYTVRIKALQFELGPTRTAYQFNYAATNIAEPPFSQVGALLYDGVNDFMVTPAINFQSYTWDGQARRNFALGSAQPENDAFWPTRTNFGITSTRVASGIDTDGLPYADIRYQGTATGTFSDGGYDSGLSRVAASSGQTLTASAIFRRVGGSMTGVSNVTILAVEETAPSTYIGQATGNAVTSTSDTLATATLTISTGNQVRLATVLSFTNGATIDVTFRMKALQLEFGSTRTAWQGTGTDEVFLCHGVRKTSDTAATIAELTVSADVTNGSWGLFPNAPGGPGIYQLRSRGTALVAANLTFNAPDTVVLSGMAKISADTALIRRNGVQVSNTGDQGTGNYSNAAIYFGMRGGVSFPLKGYEFSSICRSAFANPAQIASAEEWVRQRTAGAY